MCLLFSFSLLAVNAVLSLYVSMDIFCLAGSVQQAQQSTHWAEGLNPL